jgi:hypothetical protein
MCVPITNPDDVFEMTDVLVRSVLFKTEAASSMRQ